MTHVLLRTPCGGSPTRRDASETRRTAWQGYDAPHGVIVESYNQTVSVVVNDAIAIRPMIYLSLSFDHRVIDGAAADQSMAKLKARLQSWTAWVD